MTLTLKLPPELEQRLPQEANRQGVATGDCVLQLLDKALPTGDQRRQLVALLQSWIDDTDVEDQCQTGEFLVRALDENRTSNRQLFPDTLKGVTW